MSNAFDAVVYSLAAIYIAMGCVSLFQLFRLLLREKEDFSEKTVVFNIFWPATVQQQVHIVILVFAVIRIAFFFVAIDSWDPSSGEVIANKVAFYSLDSFATVVFFTLASVLALFWAELYYISKNEEEEFNFVIKPLTYTINVLAFVGAAVCSYIVSNDYEDDIDYIFLQYTILSATVYFIAAIMFGYYAHAAAAEIKQVPIHLSARKSRLRLLRILAFIIIIALIAKASILIAVTGENLPTVSDEALSLLFLYYFFLELFPTAVVLVFYRVESREEIEDSDERSDRSSDVYEREPLRRAGHQQGGVGNIENNANSNSNRIANSASNNGSDGAYANSGEKPKGGGFFASNRSNLRSSLPRFASNRSSTPDIVDAIIARLSSSDSRDRTGSGDTGRRQVSREGGGDFGSVSSPASSLSSSSFSHNPPQSSRPRGDLPHPGPLTLNKGSSDREGEEEGKDNKEHLGTSPLTSIGDSERVKAPEFGAGGDSV